MSECVDLYISYSPRDNIITLGDVHLCWSVQIKYLGCCFRDEQCAVDSSSFIGRFYGALNNALNILNVMGNNRNEMSEYERTVFLLCCIAVQLGN